MATTAETYRAYKGAPLFAMGFRPFFFFASIWAGLATPLWIASYLGWAPHFTRDWHVHEMLFGYVAGVVAGFLLTAVPNWTGRLPVAGWPLAFLFSLWAMGRCAMLLEPALGDWTRVIDSLFLLVLAAVVWREILAANNKRNLLICALVSVFAASNIVFHFQPWTPGGGLVAERIALAFIAMLIALVGGRITPSFTRNWMAKRSMQPEPTPQDRCDIAALALSALSLAIWVATPASPLAGAALVVSGVASFLRLIRWQGWRATAEPLLLILHIGYLWLGCALILMGVAALAPSQIPASAGVHALTTGAVGVMTLAVMTRATRGHTGRPLTAPWGTQMIYVLVNIGALARVTAALLPDAPPLLLASSAIAWSAAFALFAVLYAPLLLAVRSRH